MSSPLSLRQALPDALRLAVTAVRRAPAAAVLIALSMLVPTLLAERTIGLGVALLIMVAQLAAGVVGIAGLTRAALGRTAPPVGLRLDRDEARLLASIALSGLFLVLVALVLGLVLLAVAGATGFGGGADFAVVAQASATQPGWRMWVVLALEIATVMVLLSLWARVLPAGPATLATGQVVSLAALKWTRGSGLRPMAGLMVMLAPSFALVSWALLGAPEADWVDGVWALVLAGVQAPLLVGYATAMFRQTAPEGVAK